jgi:hypothetical protein
MRLIFALPLLLAAACSVETDDANDQISVGFDEQAIENTFEEVGNTAEQVAADVESEAERAGAAIENEVDRTDIDVDVNRNDSGE